MLWLKRVDNRFGWRVLVATCATVWFALPLTASAQSLGPELLGLLHQQQREIAAHRSSDPAPEPGVAALGVLGDRQKHAVATVVVEDIVHPTLVRMLEARSGSICRAAPLAV